MLRNSKYSSGYSNIMHPSPPETDDSTSIYKVALEHYLNEKKKIKTSCFTISELPQAEEDERTPSKIDKARRIRSIVSKYAANVSIIEEQAIESSLIMKEIPIVLEEEKENKCVENLPPKVPHHFKKQGSQERKSKQPESIHNLHVIKKSPSLNNNSFTIVKTTEPLFERKEASAKSNRNRRSRSITPENSLLFGKNTVKSNLLERLRLKLKPMLHNRKSSIRSTSRMISRVRRQSSEGYFDREDSARTSRISILNHKIHNPASSKSVHMAFSKQDQARLRDKFKGFSRNQSYIKKSPNPNKRNEADITKEIAEMRELLSIQNDVIGMMLGTCQNDIYKRLKEEVEIEMNRSNNHGIRHFR